MMVNMLMIKEKEKENLFMKMVNIILDNGKMGYSMGKEYYIIQMEILNMMVNMLMINVKEKEKVFGKMVNIILANGQII